MEMEDLSNKFYNSCFVCACVCCTCSSILILVQFVFELVQNYLNNFFFQTSSIFIVQYKNGHFILLIRFSAHFTVYGRG